jgi:UbiD family decarboxylase
VIFRDFIGRLETGDLIERRDGAVSRELECARGIIECAGLPVLFSDVGGWNVVSNVLSSRSLMAMGLGIAESELARTCERALSAPRSPGRSTGGPPCQEVVWEDPDLHDLPVLKHFEQEGGRYVTSGVMLVVDPELGPNAAYHRLMMIDGRRFTARLVEGRGTHSAYARSPQGLQAAVCIGPPVEVLLSAALHAPDDVDELEVAAAIGEIELARCLTCELEVPASSEWVLEGRLLPEMGPEGPFVDVTRTLDHVRRQPFFEVSCVTHRKSPIYHAVLPAGPEHMILMGFPRELGVMKAVREVSDAVDFRLTAGGCGWLEGVLSIRKGSDGDVEKAAKAAFTAHPSMKVLFLVDEDIPVDNPELVSWAVATRLRPSKDVTIMDDQPSSSLDPSARRGPDGVAVASKMVLDATIKDVAPSDRNRFERLC